MKKKPEVMIRINTRIRPEQYRFVKSLAGERNMGEGEVHREIIDFYIAKSK